MTQDCLQRRLDDGDSLNLKRSQSFLGKSALQILRLVSTMYLCCANIILGDLDINLQGLTFETLDISKSVRGSAKNTDCDFYIRWYLQSNGIIAQVVLGDLDLQFQGQYFKRWYLGNGESKRTDTFYDLCRVSYSLLNRITTNVVLNTFNLHFQGQTFKTLDISETVRASAKIRPITVIEVIIRHRIVSLRMLFSLTSAYIFKVKLFCKHVGFGRL